MKLTVLAASLMLTASVAVAAPRPFVWENATGGWGDYTFETVDPLDTHSDYDLEAISPIIRKRWRLIDVVEINVLPPLRDDSEVAS